MECDVEQIAEDQTSNKIQTILSDISDEDEMATVTQPRATAGDGHSSPTLAVGMYSKISSSSDEGELIEEEEEEEEEEDIDEDELYLRLIALRSLAPDLDDEKLQKAVDKDTEMVQEMEELLDEADMAADVAIETVTIDSEEEKLDEYIQSVTGPPPPAPSSPKPHLGLLMQKLRKSLARQKEKEKKATYSPTQSTIYEPDSDNTLQTACSTPEIISVPSSPALDEIQLPEGNDPQWQQQPKLDIVVVDVNGEPLPPGDEDFIRRDTPPKSPSIDAEPVDMELGSENEAEIQFFRDQPSSVWGYQQHQPVRNIPLERFFSSDRERYEADINERDLSQMPPLRKRKMSSSKARSVAAKRRPAAEVVTLESSSSDTGSDSDEDEEALRTQLLQSLALKRDAKNKVEETIPVDVIKPIEAVPVSASSAPQPKIMLKVKQFAAMAKEDSPPKSFSPLPPTPTPQPTVAEKRFPDLDLLKHRSVLIKHFPNLHSKVVISLGPAYPPPPAKRKTTAFGASLNQLLRESRKNSSKTTPPPKPARKHPPKTKSSLLTTVVVSPAAKKQLLKSSVQHLPLEQQEEYKRLKALIAKKENNATSPVNSKKTEESKEEKMRKRLLDNIQNKKSKSQSSDRHSKTSSKPVVVKKPSIQNSPKSLATAPSLSVSFNPSGRNVQMKGGSSKQTAPPTVKELEKKVVSKRTEVISELFKLSAQLSTLKDENSKLKTTQQLADQLRLKLLEVEATIVKKDERVGQLRTSVFASHQSISVRRKDLKAVEEECAAAGERAKPGYTLPTDHKATINQKLASIASNAKQMKAGPTTKAAAPKEDPATPPLVESSALAHIQAAKTPSALDPHRELCRFELQGKCNDDLCPHQHVD